LGWPPAWYPVHSGGRQAYPRSPITLLVRRARLEQTPEPLQAQLRGDLASRLLGQDANAAVARFGGRAGIFRYETVELIRFSDQGVTFEHLRGPFQSCQAFLRASPSSQHASACPGRIDLEHPSLRASAKAAQSLGDYRGAQSGKRSLGCDPISTHIPQVQLEPWARQLTMECLGE
jgi:hypothetical protein